MNGFNTKHFAILCLAIIGFLWAISPQRGYAQNQEENAFAKPEYGGRLILGTIGEPSNLISYLSSDAPSHEAAAYLSVAPLKYDKDLQVVPWAAESYRVEDGGKKLSFVLQKGIMWQDGVELTADDVEFTYQLMIAKTTPTPYAEDFLTVKEFRKTGRYGFEVYYDQPYARAQSTWMGAILPKHALEGEDLLNTKYTRNPVSSGTHILTNWSPGTRLEFQANQNYFEGRPYIDQIISRVIPDISTMFLELKAGKLDMMGLSPYQYTRQTSGDRWDEQYNKYQYLSFGYTYIGYNLKNPLFEDVRVRRAIAHAVDKKGIIHGVLMGLGQPTIGPYKPGTWPYNTEIEDYAFDPELARALLSEAGWNEKNSDGILVKDGRPFSFTLMTNQGNEQRIKIATIIQNQLEEVGIEVRIRTVEWAAFIEKFINPRNFDAIVMGWNITQDPDNYDVWHSSKYEGAGLNFGGYSNPEVDELLVKGRHMLDPEERKPVYWRIQELIHEDQPYLFLYAPLSLPIIRAEVMGVEPAPAGITYNQERWWIRGAGGAYPTMAP